MTARSAPRQLGLAGANGACALSLDHAATVEWLSDARHAVYRAAGASAMPPTRPKLYACSLITPSTVTASAIATLPAQGQLLPCLPRDNGYPACPGLLRSVTARSPPARRGLFADAAAAAFAHTLEADFDEHVGCLRCTLQLRRWAAYRRGMSARKRQTGRAAHNAANRCKCEC
jgi:hypothetical protein